MADTLQTIGDALPEHTAADTGASAPDEPPTGATGYLLTEPDDKKVCRHVVSHLWEPQERAFGRRHARWQANKLIRQGVRFVAVLQSDSDQHQYEVKAPLGSLAQPPAPNEADKICRRLTAQLIVDPPVPDVVPEGDTDREREAAEFSTRLLKADGAADALNDKGLLRTAEDKASVYGSAFSYHFIDPQGGGWRPLTVQAHPQAVRFDEADPGAVLLDPTTGAPSADYVTKFVAEDGSLSDSPVGAKMQWLPAERVDLLTGYAVRFLPETVRGIADAEGVVLAGYATLGDLARRSPAVAAMGEEQRQKLVKWRPKRWKRLLPDHAAEPKTEGKDGKVPDDALVFWLRVYYRSHAAYPKGADVWIAGGADGVVLHRAPWSVERPTADGGEVEECLELPVAQCRQLDDPITDDPYGQGLVEFLAAPEEIKATIFASVLDNLDRILNPHTFLPLGSTITGDQWAARGMGPLLYNGAAGKPEQEQVGEIPQSALLLLDMMDKAQREASGLEAPALGQSSGDVRSGKHAQQLIEQSLTSISVIKQNAEDFLTRVWRLRLQLRRCFYTIPQRLEYEGDDGAYKAETWTGADLASSKQIVIARGSFTLMAPSAKQAVAKDEYETALASAAAVPGLAQEAWEEYQRRTSDGLNAITGRQDNPHLQRVRRQLAAWKDGPPEEWQGAPAPLPVADPMTGQPQVDPMTGQPAMQQAPDPANPFADARPNDEDPAIAVVRYREISRVMSTTRYADQDPAWRAYLDAEFQRMQQAAGVQTVTQQQAAQQQAAAQQAEAEQAKGAQQSAEKDKDRQASAQQQERELAQRAASEDLRASTAMATSQGRAA